jgi:hypothetical protein
MDMETHWWALHTDNKYWTLRSLYNVCYKNGLREVPVADDDITQRINN